MSVAVQSERKPSLLWAEKRPVCGGEGVCLVGWNCRMSPVSQASVGKHVHNIERNCGMVIR